MKPKRIITCNIHSYADMNIDEINALIDAVCNAQNDTQKEYSDD